LEVCLSRHRAQYALSSAYSPAFPDSPAGQELITLHPLYSSKPQEAEEDVATLMGSIAAAVHLMLASGDNAAKEAVLACIRAGGSEAEAVLALARQDSPEEEEEAAAEASGYRWSRSEAGDSAVNVFVSPRAAAEEAAPRRDGWPSDAAQAAPPPFFAMRSSAAAPPAPAPAPAAPPAKSQGFGAAARAAAPPPPRQLTRGDDSAALAAADKAFSAVAAWHKGLPSAARLFVISVRQRKGQGTVEPALALAAGGGGAAGGRGPVRRPRSGGRGAALHRRALCGGCGGGGGRGDAPAAGHAGRAPPPPLRARVGG